MANDGLTIAIADGVARLTLARPEKHNAFDDGSKKLSDQYILDALVNSPPLSVTMAERISELREWAKGRCVRAD